MVNARIWYTICVERPLVVPHLLISKSITLESVGREAYTIIDGSSNGDVIKITANNVYIKGSATGNGFTIQNSGAPNLLTCSWGTGIFLKGSDAPGAETWIRGCNIRDITLKNNQYGIYLFFAGEATNKKNTFRNIDFTTNTDDSITLWRSNYNEFYGPDFNIFQNQDLAKDGAIQIQYSSSNNKFDDIIISGNTADGVYLKKNCNNNIIKNSDISNTRNGISLQGTTAEPCVGNRIYNNVIYDNDNPGDIWNPIGKTGIYLDASDSNDIGWYDSGTATYYGNEIYNSLTGNQEYGVYLYDSHANNIQYHDDIYGSNFGIYDNVKDGIHLDSSEGNIIAENKLLENDNGIYLDDSDHNDIIDNEIEGASYSSGITLSSSDFNSIQDNTCNDYWGDMLGYGIYLLNSDNNYPIVNNICNGNDEGIRLENSDENLISSNSPHNNNKGISLSSSSDNDIIDNTVQYNYYDGIYLQSNSDDNTIIDNMIVLNTYYGVIITSGNSDDNEIYHNNFFSNNYDIQTETYNGPQASDDSSNSWDDGYIRNEDPNYPLGGGNFWEWGDYIGRYPEAEPVLPELLVWDTPYEIPAGGNSDDYPLIYPVA